MTQVNQNTGIHTVWIKLSSTPQGKTRKGETSGKNAHRDTIAWEDVGWRGSKENSVGKKSGCVYLAVFHCIVELKHDQIVTELLAVTISVTVSRGSCCVSWKHCLLLFMTVGPCTRVYIWGIFCPQSCRFPVCRQRGWVFIPPDVCHEHSIISVFSTWPIHWHLTFGHPCVSAWPCFHPPLRTRSLSSPSLLVRLMPHARIFVTSCVDKLQ